MKSKTLSIAGVCFILALTVVYFFPAAKAPELETSAQAKAKETTASRPKAVDLGERVRLISKVVSAGQVAFTFKDGKQSDIMIIDFASGNIRPLVASPVDDEFPVWSPDGSQISFYSDMSGDREIYIIGSDGQNLRQITNSPGIDEDPEWSPDGKEIMFRSERNGNSAIFIMSADGSNVRQITHTKKTHTMPRWSPDGKHVLHSTNESWPGWDIVHLDLTTNKSEVQTSGVRTFCHGAWKPSGGAFSFSHGGGNRVNLYMKTLGGQEMRLTDYEGKDYDAAWKDDRHLFFVRDLKRRKEDYQLFLFDTELKEATQLSEHEGELREPRWTAAAAPTSPHFLVRSLTESEIIAP